MADTLFKERGRFVQAMWVATAVALVFGAFLSVQSCFPEPKIVALSWAEESERPSQSLISSSQTVIAVAKQAKASVVNVSSTTKVSGGRASPKHPHRSLTIRSFGVSSAKNSNGGFASRGSFARKAWGPA